MPLPTDFQTGTITGKYVDTAGTPMSGTITFTATTDRVASVATKTIVLTKPLIVNLDAGGTFTAVLPATNDPDISPGFQYTVSEVFSSPSGMKFSYTINVLAGTTVDLTDLSPALM